MRHSKVQVGNPISQRVRETVERGGRTRTERGRKCRVLYCAILAKATRRTVNKWKQLLTNFNTCLALLNFKCECQSDPRKPASIFQREVEERKPPPPNSLTPPGIPSQSSDSFRESVFLWYEFFRRSVGMVEIFRNRCNAAEKCHQNVVKV